MTDQCSLHSKQISEMYNDVKDIKNCLLGDYKKSGLVDRVNILWKGSIWLAVTMVGAIIAGCIKFFTGV